LSLILTKGFPEQPMRVIMHRVLSREQIRSFDRVAIDTCQVPSVVLMENAGRGAFEVVRTLLEDNDHVLVVCGSGNNGGDGFVVARHLLTAGYSVSVCLMSDPEKLRGDARLNHDAFVGLGGHVVLLEDEAATVVLETELLRADLVVDALFGTGLDREIGGRYAEAIDRINATAATRVALDLPSGLDANKGTVLGTVVVADATITFGALKLGLLTPMGARLAGEIHVASLGVPSSIVEQVGHEAEVLVEAPLRNIGRQIREQARILADDAVGIVVSSEEDVWAMRAAFCGALRTAPGRIHLMGPRPVLNAVRDCQGYAKLLELDSKSNAKGYEQLLESCDSIVFPAASEDDARWIDLARKHFDGSIVVRPSHRVGKKPKPFHASGGDVLLILGLDELGALLGADRDAVDADRFASVREARKVCHATIVLVDTQPILGIADAPLGVWGKRVDALDSDAFRALACGMMGRFSSWCEGSMAALLGLNALATAVQSWWEKRDGKGNPRIEEIAEQLAEVM
jgi:NAD(P)H-hydrate epimerase